MDDGPAGWVFHTGLRRARPIVLLYIWDPPLVGEGGFCIPLGASGSPAVWLQCLAAPGLGPAAAY